MQRDNEHDQIRAWQAGSPSAAQALVRQRQTEIRSAAYLLTLDQDQARGLTEATFARFFRAARSLNPDADTRIELFVHLGRCFLRKEFESVQASNQSFQGVPGPQKYGVENQRERTLAALGRLEDRERVALILGEVGGFEPGQLNRVVERSNAILAAPMETARQRLRQSLDIPQGDSVRPALLDAGFDGPREDLWPLLEDQIAEIQRGEQRRGQLMTYGVIAAIVLVALIAVVALFGNDLIGLNGDEPAASIDATTEPVPDDLEPMPEPTAIPATPTPTPDPLPLADLPDLIVVNEYHRQDNSHARLSLMIYDPVNNRLQPVETGSPGLTEQGISSFWVTPDGNRLLVLKDIQSDDGGVERSIVAVDRRTAMPLWEASIGSHAPNPASSMARPPAVVVSSTAAFVAKLESGNTSITVSEYALEDGSLRAAVTLEPDSGDSSLDTFDVLSLYLSPDESRLVIAAQGFHWRNNQPDTGYLVQLSLPEMEQVEGSSTSLETVDGMFSTWDAALAVDGQTLYRVEQAGPGLPLLVHFFSLDTGDWTTAEIPFSDNAGMPFFSVSRFISHDGYRLYLLDQSSGDVAVVHLTERRLERFFSIDIGSFDSRFGTDTGELVFARNPLLSRDGRWLYIAAAAHPFSSDPGNTGDSGIWVVDLTTWTIVDYWPLEDTVEAILTQAGDESILIRSRPAETLSGTSADVGELQRVGRVGGVVVNEPVGVPDDRDDTFLWFSPMEELYRGQYGRSPAIDGEAPVDLDAFSTLPRVVASGQSNVVSDISSTVTVRIFDPVGGGLLREARDDVRFDPDSTVTAYLTSDGQPGQLVVLSQTEPGIYRGSVSLPGDGNWSINVSIIAPDGTATVAAEAGTLIVSPTLTGSDGRRYQFRVSFDPGNPTVEEPATFRIRLADVESGALVPPDVHFNVEQYALFGGQIDTLPQRLSMSLGNPVTLFGSRTVISGQVGHGVWEGTITFAESGVWTVSVRMQFANIPLTEIYIRTLRVNPAPEATGLSPAEFWQSIALHETS
jgi:DNA-directed RNA polymerase specialized sigma24 family protein